MDFFNNSFCKGGSFAGIIVDGVYISKANHLLTLIQT
jgi:hypothetical protein